MNLTRLFILLAAILLLTVALVPCFAGVTRSVIVIESLLAVAVILAVLLYFRVVRPLHVTSMGMDLLREQDYGSRLAPVGQRDADRIVELFNDLMGRLKAERLRTLETDRLLGLLIEASPMGILSLDKNERVIMCNSASCRILATDPKGMKLAGISSPIACECATLGKEESRVIRLTDTMVYRCSRLSFMDRGIARPFILIESLTDEVRRAEREAYGKVIRVIGHEVNNSLTSISSLLSLLLEIRPWGEDLMLTEAVEGSAHRAARLGEFISAYTNVVKIPPLHTAKVTLGKMVSDMAPFLQSMTVSAGVRLNIVDNDPSARAHDLDIPLMEQAMVNIVKNAIESIGQKTDGEITVETSSRGRLTVTDNGPGLSAEASRSLFTPFFSTKPSGQGLGLMFVAEILRRHGATFSLETSPDDRLTRFKISFT